MFSDIVAFIRSAFNTPEGFIPLHEPRFSEKDKAYVMDAIDSTFVSSVGKYVDQFEQMAKAYTGAQYAIAAVNGTAALHMSLLLAGVKQGDLVITQPLSFIATCNAISYLKAEPLFIDIETDTLGLSPDALGEFLTNNVKVIGGEAIHTPTGKRISACVPMHTFGLVSKIEALLAWCNKFNIPLIEDAAESIGSFYGNQHTGTFGLLGAFSFNGNKTITCGGGGLIVTNNEKLGKLAKHMTTQAKVPHRWEFVHDHIGYNYRMPNLNAAMACAQMEQLDAFLTNKRALSQNYKAFFSAIPDIDFINETPGTKANFWLNAILLKDRATRDAFLAYTNDNGVMTRPVWELMNRLTMFANCICEPIPNAIEIADRLVNIPSSVRIK